MAETLSATPRDEFLSAVSKRRAATHPRDDKFCVYCVIQEAVSQLVAVQEQIEALTREHNAIREALGVSEVDSKPLCAYVAELLEYLHTTRDADGIHHPDWVADCQQAEQRAEALTRERDDLRLAYRKRCHDADAIEARLEQEQNDERQRAEAAELAHEQCRAALNDERTCHAQTVAGLKRAASEEIRAANERAEAQEEVGEALAEELAESKHNEISAWNAQTAYQHRAEALDLIKHHHMLLELDQNAPGLQVRKAGSAITVPVKDGYSDLGDAIRSLAALEIYSESGWTRGYAFAIRGRPGFFESARAAIDAALRAKGEPT